MDDGDELRLVEYRGKNTWVCKDVKETDGDAPPPVTGGPVWWHPNHRILVVHTDGRIVLTRPGRTVGATFVRSVVGDGRGAPAGGEVAFCSDIPRYRSESLRYRLLSLDLVSRSRFSIAAMIATVFSCTVLGGGGSCRRQGKSVQTEHFRGGF